MASQSWPELEFIQLFVSFPSKFPSVPLFPEVFRRCFWSKLPKISETQLLYPCSQLYFSYLVPNHFMSEGKNEPLSGWKHIYTKNHQLFCYITSIRFLAEYRMIFQEHTTIDYAKIENSITNDLNAVSVCFFARDNDANKPDTEQCLFSYTVNGADNSLLIITSPTLRVIINDKKR